MFIHHSETIQTHENFQPHSYSGQAQTMDPYYAERRLYARILLDAIKGMKSRSRLNRDSAIAYFTTQSDWIGGLASACEILGLDVDIVRKRVLSGKLPSIKKKHNRHKQHDIEGSITTYWGKACIKPGHVFDDGHSLRYLRTGNCVRCQRETNKRYRNKKNQK